MIIINNEHWMVIIMVIMILFLFRCYFSLQQISVANFLIIFFYVNVHYFVIWVYIFFYFFYSFVFSQLLMKIYYLDTASLKYKFVLLLYYLMA